jgi:hypothetical protein
MRFDARRLMMPWARPSDLYCAPGRVVLKLTLGEAPEAIPSSLDVRMGASEAALTVDGGVVDRILKRFSDRVRVVRVHSAAASRGRPGVGHRRFDDVEHAIGLSRTFRVDADHDCCIADLVDALRQLDHVEHASPYYLCALPFAHLGHAVLDPEKAWHSREQIRAREAMAHEQGDPALIIALVDTGVEGDHPELTNRLRPGFDTVELGPRDLSGGLQLLGDLSGPDPNPDDENGHGTSCAGIIGASGQRIPPGLAGQCSVMPMRVLGSARLTGKAEPIGIGAIPDIDAGVKRAIDLDAKVLNMSFGTLESALGEHDPPPHADVVRYGLARECIMIAASGNSGRAERCLPAALEGVIAVGSVNAEGKPSTFTTRGDHVALCAPGERVVTTGLHGYQMVTGTSFAAPFVTATVALLVSRARRRSYPLDHRAIKRIVCESARPWPPGQERGYGTGVLDTAQALRTLDQEINRSAHPEPNRAP